MAKKNRIKGKKLTQAALKNAIIKSLKRDPRSRFSARQIVKKLKIKNSKDSVHAALRTLSKEGKIEALSNDKFRASRKAASPTKTKAKAIVGIVDMTRSGAAYIVVDDAAEDVYVPAKFLSNAMHGDKVAIELRPKFGRRRPEGKVLRVLERASSQFVGIFRHSRKYGIVYVERPKASLDIRVKKTDAQKVKDGDKVVVRVTDFGQEEIWGQVVTVLTGKAPNDIEMDTILISHGFDLSFPEAVITESDAIPAATSDLPLNGRRDFRDVLTFTIDPEDAQDFDDALSYRALEDGVEVGIHIADVTHYVRPDSALDKEAYRRSTSVYLVDRVAPMLPEKLSNQLCSLRPNEEKYTFSAVFQFDSNWRVTDEWFGKSIIHSDRRFTYEEAQKRIRYGRGDLAAELRILNRIAKKLRRDRFKQGAISFEAEEVRFRLDEAGKPIDVYTKERFDAHLLIEDFMLLANRAVGRFMAQKLKGVEVPFVYRVHDAPNPDKLAEFAIFAAELGLKLRLDTPKNIAKSFNDLAKEARKNEVLKMLEPMAIRTMSKAIYTTDNIGHYGLGFEYYSHFTSPIRRYADVLAHRILEKNLNGVQQWSKTKLEDQCKHISAQERKALDAERESIKLKQVEYMQERIGERFEGFISGMIDKGVFIELKGSKAEGMAIFDEMGEPFFVGPGYKKMIGRHTGRVLKMGDAVEVVVLKADTALRQIEFELLPES